MVDEVALYFCTCGVGAHAASDGHFVHVRTVLKPQHKPDRHDFFVQTFRVSGVLPAAGNRCGRQPLLEEVPETGNDGGQFSGLRVDLLDDEKRVIDEMNASAFPPHVDDVHTLVCSVLLQCTSKRLSSLRGECRWDVCQERFELQHDGFRWQRFVYGG
jgi:hypothetical protein